MNGTQQMGGAQPEEQAGTGKPVETTSAEEGRTFTQEQLNAIVQERLAKERAKGGLAERDRELTEARQALADMEKTHAEKISALERRHSVDKVISGHEFVNDITKNYIAEAVIAALGDEANKGRTAEDIFKQLTHEGSSPKAGIFLQKNPNRLPGPPPAGNIPRGDGETIRQAMGLQR